MDNYIVINGKKAELTDEQLKALGITLEAKSPFDMVAGVRYYYILPNGKLSFDNSNNMIIDKARYNVANYCIDKDMMEQRALHETLNRLLWRYSMEHDGDKIDWNGENKWWWIVYDCDLHHFISAFGYRYCSPTEIYFYNKEIANNAMEEIVKPFMREHPDFVW